MVTSTSTANRYSSLQSFVHTLPCATASPPSLPQGIQFYTQTKTITSLWRSDDANIASMPTVMPTMK